MFNAIPSLPWPMNFPFIVEKRELIHSRSLDVLQQNGISHLFTPGLVGGHCIGIDPYYLIERAKSKSLDLPLVSTARCINENETFYRDKKISDLIGDKDCSILILGASYKANISDIRNSKSIEIIKRLHDQGVTIMAFDPIIDTSLLSPEIESLFIKDQSELIQRYDIVIKLCQSFDI